MSTYYRLELDTNFEPAHVMNMLSDELKVELIEWNGSLNLRAAGIWIGIQNREPSGQQIIQDAYGFRPTVVINFEIYDREDTEAGKQLMVRAVLALLGRMPGDAVLLFNGEHTVLQRIGGKLAINRGLDSNIVPSFALANLPLVSTDLPSPLL
jgi:hypothetical protein